MIFIKKRTYKFIAAIFISLTAFLSCESFFIFHPNKDVTSTPEDIGLEFEDVFIDTEDGIKIHGWYVPSKKERGTVLFCHGNAGNISCRLDTVRIFKELDLSVLIFDYRGYGRSGGEPSEEGTYSDALASWDYLVNNKMIPPEKIIAWGRSLGGAVAAWLAKNRTPGLLIMESSFTSVEDVAEFHLPVIPGSLIFGDTYNTLEIIDDIKCPVMIIHSPGDEIIPYSQGQRLFMAASEPKEFLEISGSHNNGFFVSVDRYKKSIDRFIGQYHVR